MPTPVPAAPPGATLVPLHGLPCAVCQTPAAAAHVGPGGSRIYHQHTVVGTCETGTPPPEPARTSP